MHAFAVRRGKAAVLNDVVPRARGAIVVFADARQRFEPDTVRALTRPFADPAVGAVSGELILTEAPMADGGPRGRRLLALREAHPEGESRVDSTVGATGAIYAIRRELFEPIPEDTLLDDVLIPLRIVRRATACSSSRPRAPRTASRPARGRSSRERCARSRATSSSSCASPGCSTLAGIASGSRRCRTRACASWAAVLHAGAFAASAALARGPAVPGRAGGPGALLCAGPGRSCHAELAPPKPAPVRALRRLPPQLGDRGGVLAIRHGAPERVVGARIWSSPPGHRGMETTASVTVEAVESASSAH